MEYQEYLDGLNTEEREYVTKFFNRKDYIEHINSIAIKNSNEIIASGKGNCNSKIAVIVNDYVNLDIVTKFIKPIFESINTSMWNIYITSIKKADCNNAQLWNEMIQHELNAVSPQFSFMFVNDKQSFTEEEYAVFNKTLPVVYVNLDDVQYVLDKDNFKSGRYIQIMNNLYKYVLKLIQYREIEISE